MERDTHVVDHCSDAACKLEMSKYCLIDMFNDENVVTSTLLIYLTFSTLAECRLCLVNVKIDTHLLHMKIP